MGRNVLINNMLRPNFYIGWRWRELNPRPAKSIIEPSTYLFRFKVSRACYKTNETQARQPVKS